MKGFNAKCLRNPGDQFLQLYSVISRLCTSLSVIVLTLQVVGNDVNENDKRKQNQDDEDDDDEDDEDIPGRANNVFFSIEPFHSQVQKVHSPKVLKINV